MLNEGLTDKIVLFTPNNMNKIWDKNIIYLYKYQYYFHLLLKHH